MKIKFLKLKNWLVVSLMGVLGLSSCRSHKNIATPEVDPEPVPLSGELAEPKPQPRPQPREEIRVMYGVPTMDFLIRGQVKDANGRPVRDIRVNMLERGMHVKEGQIQGDPDRVNEWLTHTEIVTDAEGRFEVKASGLPSQEVRLLVRDVDGPKNGSFSNQLIEVPVEPDDVNTEGASGWNQGTFEKTLEVKLEKK